MNEAPQRGVKTAQGFKELFEKAKQHPEYWKMGCELCEEDNNRLKHWPM